MRATAGDEHFSLRPAAQLLFDDPQIIGAGFLELREMPPRSLPLAIEAVQRGSAGGPRPAGHW
jgi:hypothetical protein